jgi:hypothetical protein
MIIAKWIYRIVWVFVLVFLAMVLGPWQYIGAMALIIALVFSRSVVDYGEFADHVAGLHETAQEIVEAGERNALEYERLVAELRQHTEKEKSA